MSLSASLDIAKSGLAVAARETAVVSRNVATAGEPLVGRKSVQSTTAPGGGVQATVVRATDAALFDRLLSVTSRATQTTAVADLLNRLNETVGDPVSERSPAALVGKLRDALQTYSEAPNDDVRAQAAVSAASTLAETLRTATAAVQSVRQQADAGIGASVERINTLLSQFGDVNQVIVSGTRTGADITGELDRRDAILSRLSEEIGIRTVARAGNDMAIYTESGVTLFDRSARAVSFQATPLLGPVATGAAVFADGVPVTGDTAVMPVTSGRIAGLAAIRDALAPLYQTQLDEVARGLIEAFAETDQSATPTGLPQPGLFTFSGATGVPASGAAVAGLAGQIVVAQRADLAQGGDPLRLRDGDISGAGAAYVYNATGAAGFSDRIRQLGDAISSARAFDPAANLQQSGSLTEFAASSAAWLQDARKTAGADAEHSGALRDRASEALSNATGVNLDDEMARLLELERSYQASSRLITAVDDMYAALFQALR